MTPFRTAIITAALCAMSPAAVRSGMASAEWLAATATYEPGQPVLTAVRLVVDKGWHSYWENPGEAGMKTSVKWELPPGWNGGELEQPAPIRFMTGQLAGFGYVGTVDFPVAITPPADAAGPVKLKATISWLTCSEERCIPGTAELELDLTAGKPVPGDDAAAVEAASRKIPRPRDGLTLEVAESGKSLALTIRGGPDFDATAHDVFPATFQAVDPAAKFEFRDASGAWHAVVPKNEYATKPADELALVLAPKDGGPPILVKWLRR